ncbi:unnamed protein product [Sphagnum jensenii]|uniref:beta-galactosidase n=1 Tax=Sphagnum jensenii TaxID=128206 RepID=A0ABP1AYS1_9BRYO
MLVKMGNHDHHLKGLLLLLILFFFFSSFPSSSSCTSVTMQDGLPFQQLLSTNSRSFEISGDMFVKDGLPFRILGGELHYFRILPQLWKDRLLRAKALGLNTIQTYVPWNLHEPDPEMLNFNGLADLPAFLELAHELDFLVMLRIGPYICGEWDFGGFPAWLLALQPPVQLRSSNHLFLNMVDRWWDLLLPILAPSLYTAGGCIIMIQIENEYGSFGSDHVYLHHLLDTVREHLGNNVIIYTTDGAAVENLENGSLQGCGVYTAIDFPTGSDPSSAFALQKHYNPAGMSPPLSAEFYTGWLTHWGEQIAQTDAASTASDLDHVLSLNASVVLYMVHGGTSFGFQSGANTGAFSFDFQPDITSYDYDAPIGEAGDVSNAKFQAIREVMSRYVVGTLPDPPPLPERRAYGLVTMDMLASLFDLLESLSQPPQGVSMDWPVPMEQLKQASGFILYRSKLPASVQPGSKLSVVQVYDRAQVFVGNNSANRMYLGTLERWSANSLTVATAAALPGSQLDILVENMGRVNYGPFMGENKGITEAVFLDDTPILGWTAYPIELNDISKITSNIVTRRRMYESGVEAMTSDPDLAEDLQVGGGGPAFYRGVLKIENSQKSADTFISFRGWTKGVAFVNGFNLGRFWPSIGPQCTLYVPAPLLHSGDNELILLELESLTTATTPTVQFVNKGDFTCGIKSS